MHEVNNSVVSRVGEVEEKVEVRLMRHGRLANHTAQSLQAV
jgi:hypothetical protein